MNTEKDTTRKTYAPKATADASPEDGGSGSDAGPGDVSAEVVDLAAARRKKPTRKLSPETVQEQAVAELRSLVGEVVAEGDPA
ncbi:hypothetical protein [Mycobacterium riyadhense]|uniref:Uncharacterized protein n=1 Tax=Mycobacterium riyadhense TaxID=486698 RepID=A0A1X2CM36_9MYCO|nr:hypothetical protein [Mycobacterium riyadhense]MCV7145917.1 hypothetical protein [Mycobacterium riyadhense]ORW76853.1 hypothetical protein AWC22_21060 [Mycobacterium riyadhense]